MASIEIMGFTPDAEGKEAPSMTYRLCVSQHSPSSQVALFSFHIMGTARLGGSPAISATNPDGECWETHNLYVMDGASFPSASGVNPMISIEAIAHRSARALAARS